MQSQERSPRTILTHETGRPSPFYWGVGEPGRPPRDQPGSWTYAILPFLEQENPYRERAWTEPVKLYICPSRQPGQTLAPGSRLQPRRSLSSRSRWAPFFGRL
jgi:hypothetical protein